MIVVLSRNEEVEPHRLNLSRKLHDYKKEVGGKKEKDDNRHYLMIVIEYELMEVAEAHGEKL